MSFIGIRGADNMSLKKTHHFFIVIVLLFSTISSCKKDEPSSFQAENYFKLFGYAYEDIAVDMVTFGNFHYLVGNIKASFDSDRRYILVVKTDLFGNRIWQKEIERTNDLTVSDIIKLRDESGIALVGSYLSEPNMNRSDMYFQKISSEGDTASAIIYDHPFDEKGKCIGEFKNGDFVLVGEHNDTLNTSNTYKFSISIDSNGELIKYGDIFNGTPPQRVNGMAYAENLDLFLASGYGPNAKGSAFTFTVNHLGTYSNTYYYNIEAEFSNIIIEPNVGVYACGNLKEGTATIENSFITSLDPYNGGDFLWYTEVEGESNGISYNNESLYLTGTLYENQESNMTFKRFDMNGGIEFEHETGGSDFDYGMRGFPEANGYIIFGTTYRGNTSLITLLKTNISE